MKAVISSKVENDYLVLIASGNISSYEEYQLQVKLYCDEIMKFGLDKIIIDESKVQYAPSLVLQMDIVEYYSSGELPYEFKNWKIACIGSKGSMEFFNFWEDVAQRSGYNHRAFVSLEAARKFMNK